MEYTDCENCLRLEAENADLVFENEELRERLALLNEAIGEFNDRVESI